MSNPELETYGSGLNDFLTDGASFAATQIGSARHVLPVLTLIALCGDQTSARFLPALTSKLTPTLDGQRKRLRVSPISLASGAM